MTWCRFESRYPRHRKVEGLSDQAFRLDMSSICWCMDNLTDGEILTHELDLVSRLSGEVALAAADELVRMGRWDITKRGWKIHDYLEYNPSRDRLRRERESKAIRQDRWRRGKDVSHPNGVDASRDAPRDTSRDPPRDASRDVSVDASRDASRDASSRGAREIPTQAGTAWGRNSPRSRPAVVNLGFTESVGKVDNLVPLTRLS